MSPTYHYRSPRVRRAAALLERALRAVTAGKNPLPPPGEVRRILLVKPDHLGDVVMASSVLPLVRRRFPEARIDFVANKEGAEFLSGDPLVGKVHVHEHLMLQRAGSLPMRALRHVASFFPAVRAVRRERYDLCLLLRSHFDNDLFLALFGRCRFIAGHGTDGFGPLLDAAAEWREGVHETRHALEVLEAAGIPTDDAPAAPRVEGGADDVAAARRLMELHGLSPGGFIVLHPGTGNPAKQWGAGRWRELARMMAGSGRKVVLTGSLAEAGLLGEIAAGIAGVEDLSGRLTVRRLAVLIGNAGRLVCLDSLSAHLGSASGTETFVIYGGLSDPSRWAPIGPNVRLLGIDLSPEEVFRAVLG
ncbi:MAG: ADP-heptose:LPS heptosyltransferase-like protein [Deltaproteobacteria bacterium]|nr:ADP-heptose:LPS heptosyltransferase-like protein [Deltaproteobacteria bacterium]